MNIETRRGESLGPEGLTVSQERLSDALFEIGAIKFGAFRLKLHEQNPEIPLSPIYIDLRILRRFPEFKAMAVDVYEEILRPLAFDLLADIPMAATPFVSSLSDKLGVGMITPRIDSKNHGTGAKVDGLLDSDWGMTAVLIDDLVTKAHSKLEAAEVLKNQGIIVRDVVVLIDREQGGREELKDAGLELHSALTMRQMLDYYVRTGKITQELYQQIKANLELFNRFLGL